MAATSTVRVIFVGNTSSAVRSVAALDSSFNRLGRTARLVGTALGVVVAGGLVAATRQAIGFDRAMRNVNTLSRLSEKQFAALGKQVLALAKTSGQGPQTLAEGLYDLVSSGIKANDAIGVLNASAKAATAGLTDTKTATKAVVAVLNAYGLQANKAREVSDVLFQVVNRGVVTFEELAQQMGDLVTPAAQMGVSIKDVGGAFAALTLQGGPAAERATQVRQLLVSMLKPSESLQGALRGLGYESAQVALKQDGFVEVIGRLSTAAKGNQATIADWFPNVRALAGFMGLAGDNTKKFEEIVRSMDGATKGAGATSRAFAEQAKSISVQWQIAKASLAAAAVPIGQLLFPALIKVTNAVASMASFMNQHMPQIRAVFEAMAAGINRAWESHGRRAFDAMRSAISQTVAFVRQHWPEIRTTIASVLTYLSQNVIPPFRSVLQSLGRITEDLASIFRTAWPAIRLALVSAAIISAVQLRILAAAMQVLAGVVSVLRSVIEGSFRAGAAAVTAASGVIGGALGAARAAIAGFVAAIQAAWNWLKNLAQAISAVPVIRMPLGALTAFVGAVGGVVGAIGTLIGAINNIPRFVNIAVNFIVGRLPSIPSKPKTLAGPGGRFQRAFGGFIPGPVGAPVPILAHAGEVVLNPKQQAALGGPRLLASMFGFTGDEGPGFATGGFVKKVPPKPSRSHGRKRDYKVLTEIARTALRGVSAIDAREAAADTGFQQTVRQFNISQETYFRPENVPLVYGSSAATILQEVPGQIPTAYRGPTSGFETRDPTIKPGDPVLNEFGEPQFTEVQVLDIPQIQQRLREIKTLLQMRQNFIGLLDDEKNALEKAIAAINQAIEELRAEIQREIKAAEEETKRIRQLKAEIAGKRKQVSAEQRKKKPNKGAIGKLNADIARMEKEVTGHEGARSDHQNKATKLRDIVKDLASDKTGLGPNLRAIPTDKRNVQLDIAELQTERSDIRGLKSETAQTEQIPAAQAVEAGGDGGAEDGGGGGDTGGPSGLAEDSDLVKALKEMIGKLRLALGIQEAQLGVLGSFALGGFTKGPQGVGQLALLHGGEVVLNPAQQSVLGGPERIARIFGFQRFAKGGFVDGPLFSDPGGGGPPPPPPTGGPPSGNQGLPPPTQTIDIPGSLVGSFGGAPRLNVQSVVRTDSTTRRGGDSVVVNVPPPQGARINVTNQARDEALKQFLDKAIDTRIEQVHLPAFGRTLAKSADTARREGK